MPQDDCFGPVQNPRTWRFGQCRYCWDENWAHRHHTYFGGRQTMVGPVCRHRLVPVKHRTPQFVVNALERLAREQEQERSRSGEAGCG